MFEREIRDASFVTRWGIARTLRQQSIADHQFMVAVYANDICCKLGVDMVLHLDVLQHALWHDTEEEIFSGDMPGPSKRAMVSDKATWAKRLSEWCAQTFGAFHIVRNGMGGSLIHQTSVKYIVKAADWLDAACEMATEKQLGNQNVEVHIVRNTDMCCKAIRDMCQYLGKQEYADELQRQVRNAVKQAAHGQSLGPVIADPAEYQIAVDLGLITPAS